MNTEHQELLKKIMEQVEEEPFLFVPALANLHVGKERSGTEAGFVLSYLLAEHKKDVEWVADIPNQMFELTRLTPEVANKTLKKLERMGLIQSKSEGTAKLYQLDVEAIKRADNRGYFQ